MLLQPMTPRLLRKLGFLFIALQLGILSAQEIPPLVARYTFDAPVGFAEPCVAGEGEDALVIRNGHQHAAARREPGRFGMALRPAERVPVETRFPASGDFSVSFWFHADEPRADSLFHCGDLGFSSGRSEFLLHVHLGEGLLRTPYEQATWNCVVLTSDGRRMVLYLNGKRVGKTEGAPATDLRGQKLRFANFWAPHGQFHGLFD